MKEEKGILEEMNDFLEYLAKNDHNETKRKKENLIKKFGKENYWRIYSLLVGEGRIGSLPKKEKNTRTEIIHVNSEGLKSLEEYQKGKRDEGNQRVMLFLTTMLVITTISTFFNQLNMVSPLALMLIYGFMTFFIWRYFKKSKKIQI